MAVGRDIRLSDVGCVPVSIIARVPAVTAAMDLASGSGRGGTLLYHNSVTLLPLPSPSPYHSSSFHTLQRFREPTCQFCC